MCVMLAGCALGLIIGKFPTQSFSVVFGEDRRNFALSRLSSFLSEFLGLLFLLELEVYVRSTVSSHVRRTTVDSCHSREIYV